MAELALRFVIGGIVVSAFAAIGEVFQPKSFAGLFGAAPSVAIVTLALTYHSQGASTVATMAHWMLIGTIAMLAYCTTCIWVCRHDRIPVAAGAFAAWLVWAAVATVA